MTIMITVKGAKMMKKRRRMMDNRRDQIGRWKKASMMTRRWGMRMRMTAGTEMLGGRF